MPERRPPLRLHVDAQAELQNAVYFYRQRGGNQIAARFKEHLAAGFTAITATPKLFPQIRDLAGVQKFPLKHFPFSILYVNRADYIWVVAIAHGSRRPGYWKERLH